MSALIDASALTTTALCRELQAIRTLLPRILPTSPQSVETRRAWIQRANAIRAEIARRNG